LFGILITECKNCHKISDPLSPPDDYDMRFSIKILCRRGDVRVIEREKVQLRDKNSKTPSKKFTIHTKKLNPPL